VSNQPQLTKEQVMDIIKNVVVSVDVNNNAVVISALKLITYFMKDVQDIEKILKVDITEDKDKVKKLVVYAKAKPKNQFIESLIVKAVLKNNILSMLNTKYEFIKNGDDVYIKLYLQPNQSQDISTTNSTEEVDF
jgi:NCAIR mutase (PurE)-related protein